jgi:hypothetical protein
MATTTLEQAQRLLRVVGYADDYVRTQYPVWLGRNDGTKMADAVAFARLDPVDMSTAVITVSLGRFDDGYQIAGTIASPYLLQSNGNDFELWVLEPEGPNRWRDHINLENAGEVRDWLRPEAALRSKVGLRQLPLFDVPVNLLAAARASSADRIGPLVKGALDEASSALGKVNRTGDEAVDAEAKLVHHRRSARLVVAALTSLVLRDRNDWRKLGPTQLAETTSRLFPTAYGWYNETTSRERSVLTGLIGALGDHIDYSSFDPAILIQVYEEALVSADDRSKLGIHYTPPRLANKILQSLPVELIPPEKRTVLDPACGSGTLLVAAHDRLRDLQPKDWTTDQRHQDLAIHLQGIDIDHYATEIARNTLFLHANPAGNGWHIKTSDTLDVNPDDVSASIIVTNPPWKFLSRYGTRSQAANEFVRWSVHALTPGGLLAIILPQAWLSAKYSSTFRSQLTDELEIFEVWRLPDNVFPTSKMSSCVLFGRKRDGLGGRGSRIVREFHPSNVGRFLDRGIARSSYLVTNSSTDLWRTMEIPPMGNRVRQLDEIADILSGSQPKAGIGEGRKEGILFLNHFSDVRPYAHIPTQRLWRLLFPDDFQTGRGAKIIDKKKVLVPAARSISDPWRIRVSVDTVGVAFRNSMRGVAPKRQDDDSLLYALSIILGSGFASAFVASFGADRNIPAHVLKQLPIPTDTGVIEEISQIGRSAAAYADADDMESLRLLLHAAEDVVWDAYGISNADRSVLTIRLAGESAPEGVPRYPALSIDDGRKPSGLRRIGCVLDVDGHRLRVWVNGVTSDDGTDVELPMRMPGWLVRSGATFDAFGIESPTDLTDANYKFQPESWSDLDFDSAVPAPLFGQNGLGTVSK